jgi:two-component system OmpR family response regulator
MRVLIAEDDPTISVGLTRAMREAGYATDHVNTGTAADSALTAQSFDLVILDIGLPGLDGFQVLNPNFPLARAWRVMGGEFDR